MLCHRTPGYTTKRNEPCEGALRREIDCAVADGYTCFMSGFAEGADQYFVEIVMELQKENPAAEADCGAPVSKAAGRLKSKAGTYEMLEACADVVVMRKNTSPAFIPTATVIWWNTLTGDCCL